MGNWVSDEAKRAARKADLFQFLISHHPDRVKIEGNTLRLKDNKSITVKRGYAGWKDWATDETGNGIDLLQNYFGYDFVEAVTALSGDYLGLATPAPRVLQPKPEPVAPDTFAPPPPLQGRYRQLYAYLTKTRMIPAPTVQQLIDDGILYQDADHGNMVFVNPARTFYEVRGTNTYKPFHQVQFSDLKSFWWTKMGPMDSDATVAYVCEASIDAISLLLLHKKAGITGNGLYCGIGGVANQDRIDAIKAGMAAAGCRTVIAVDNDDAGQKCRDRNPDCKFLIPVHKDWNEDWIAVQKEG